MIQHLNGDVLILIMYAMILFLRQQCFNMILGMKKKLISYFDIDLKFHYYFLGNKVLQIDDGVSLSQPMCALN